MDRVRDVVGRSTAIECLTIGCVMPITSDSWNGVVPRSVVVTCPVMNSVGTESMWASAIAVRRFVAPGPLVTIATPTRPGRPRVALGGVAGGGLVAHQDVADRRVVQRVVDRQARAAGQAEDGVDPRGSSAAIRASAPRTGAPQWRRRVWAVMSTRTRMGAPVGEGRQRDEGGAWLEARYSHAAAGGYESAGESGRRAVSHGGG